MLHLRRYIVLGGMEMGGCKHDTVRPDRSTFALIPSAASAFEKAEHCRYTLFEF